jgi:hypothetical protein
MNNKSKILNALIGEARTLAYNYRPGDTGVITAFTGKYFAGEKKQKLDEAIKISPDAAEQCLKDIY